MRFVDKTGNSECKIVNIIEKYNYKIKIWQNQQVFPSLYNYIL